MTDLDSAGDWPRARDLVYPRLVNLIEVIDESAAIVYPRALHRRHMTRLLVFLIGLSGSVTSGDLVLATGYEKAQISRGLKGLAEAGLIDRPEVRGRIRLNEAGQALFEQIMVIARDRDARLREGLTQADMARFLEMTGTLIERTSGLVPAEEPGGVGERRRTSISAPSVHDLILPALRSLMVYVRRSNINRVRSGAGLTNLEWRVLALISENVPISLSALIPLVARDKSQVARAVKQLHALDLIRRHDEGRVNVTLELTEAGEARHEKILAIGRRHDDIVFAGFRPDERRFYIDMLDHITRNATAVLAAESATIGVSAAPDHDARSGAEAEMDRLRSENRSLRRQLDSALGELSALRAKAP